jgi:quercetin dioxygenase-like cupin family protein
VRIWNVNDIETPEGTRSPVVLHSKEGAARAVIVGLQPGQALGDHQVKENAFVLVVEGEARIESAGDAVDCPSGTLAIFEPDERHAVSSTNGARILLLLAPWPGAGHFRGDEEAVSLL